MYLDAWGDQIGITYKRPGEHRMLRRPFEHHLIKFPSNHLLKDERKKLLAGKGRERAFIRSDSLICVSTKEMPAKNSSLPAVRVPYRSDKEDLIAWVFIHFNVREISLLTTPNRVKVTGELKQGNCLTWHKMELVEFQTCGDAGGKTKSGPCPLPVSHDVKDRFPDSPGYMRCKKHLRCRPEDLESLYKRSTKNFCGKGIFWFMNKETIMLVPGHVAMSDPRIERFSELNGKLIRDLLEDVM